MKPISDLLIGKTPGERAAIKCREIGKLKMGKTHEQHGIRIEIQSMSATGDFVEVYAKAWRGNMQLGFSPDGSVEIERFKIYNPPILVDDPDGDIVREFEHPTNGNVQRKLKEDPERAIKEHLISIVQTSGKGNDNIVKGKVGRTTTTTFATADTQLHSDNPTTNYGTQTFTGVGDSAGADKMRGLYRFAIPSGSETINTITMKLNLLTHNGAGTHDVNAYCDTGSGPSMNWTNGNATWNNYSSGNAWTAGGAASDFSASVAGKWTRTGGAATEAYYDFIVYGTGSVTPIAKTWGDTVNLLIRETVAGNNDYFYTIDNTGTSKDPYLLIDSGGGGATTVTKTHTVDSLVKADGTQSHTLDALVKDAASLSHSVDSLVAVPVEIGHTIDAHVLDSTARTHTVDSLVRAEGELSHTLDSLVKATTAVEFTADALVRAENELAHSVDASVKASGQAEHSVDSLVRDTFTLGHDVDALVKAASEVSHSVDATVLDSLTLSHTVDSHVALVYALSCTVDAYVSIPSEDPGEIVSARVVELSDVRSVATLTL